MYTMCWSTQNRSKTHINALPISGHSLNTSTIHSTRLLLYAAWPHNFTQLNETRANEEKKMQTNTREGKQRSGCGTEPILIDSNIKRYLGGPYKGGYWKQLKMPLEERLERFCS